MNNTAKPSKPPFIKQQTPDSCVPACLRMVFAGFGLMLPEEELCALCDCTFFGTDAFQAVEAARYCGFSGTTKQTLTIDEVETIVSDGLFPIVYLDLAPIDGIHQPHAFVILSVTPFGVMALDPAKGERLIPRDVFFRGVEDAP